MNRTVILFIIFTFTIVSCKAMKQGTVISITLTGENKKTITANKGDTLLVKLPMASGTGFVWEVSGKPNFCKQGNTNYEQVKKSVPGAPLMEVINFTISASGREDISFVYHRPFGNKAAVETRILHLIIP